MQELKRVLFGLAGFLPVALTQSAEVQRPNIIVFLADDMGVTAEQKPFRGVRESQQRKWPSIRGSGKLVAIESMSRMSAVEVPPGYHG